QRQRSLAAIAGWLIEVQCGLQLRDGRVVVVLQVVDAAQRQMRPHLGNLRFISAREFQGLLEITGRRLKIAADESKTQIDEPVCCDVFDVVGLRYANRVGSQLFRALDVSLVATNEAQLEFGAGELIIVLLALQHLQDFLELGLGLSQFAGPEEKYATLEDYFDQAFVIGEHLIDRFGALECALRVVNVAPLAVCSPQTEKSSC